MTDFTPAENARTLWDASLEVIREFKSSKVRDKNPYARPRILGQIITTIPPDTTEPEEIQLHYVYDGNLRDVNRTLAITPEGPKTLKYTNMHWGSADAEDEADQNETYGPTEHATLDWLGQLANCIREA